MESVSGLNNREVERNASVASARSSILAQFPGVQVSADITDHRCTELGGKVIGQPTFVRRCAPCRRSRAHSRSRSLSISLSDNGRLAGTAP